MTRLVNVMNGPNLNLLGKRQPDIYGHETLDDVERLCAALAAEPASTLRLQQSNREGQLIDRIDEARDGPGSRSTPAPLPIPRSRSSTRSTPSRGR